MTTYRMHTMGAAGQIGRKRFLPWHRAYLLHFEKALRSKEPAAFIPYWKWSDGTIPSWIEAFEPSVDIPGHGIMTAKRNKMTSSVALASTSTSLLAINKLIDFTYALEAGPHNKGHRDVGGPMTSVFSPTDPIFFLHHCQVDRLWSQWQIINPLKKSSLTGKQAIMDPWSDTVTSLNSTTSLGYTYL